MKKSDLKTGMNIYFSDNTVGTVLLNTEYDGIVASPRLLSGTYKRTWFPLRDYQEDLSKWDIGTKGNKKVVTKVTQPTNPRSYLNYGYDERVVWERTKETITIGNVKYDKEEFEKAVKHLKPLS